MFKITVIGNLGKDAETKMINNTPYTVFTVCHSQQRKDAQGNYTQTTEWVSCKRKQLNGTDTILPYLIKGSKVCIMGDFYTRTYTTQQGEKMFELNCNVSHIELIARPQQQLPTTGAEQPQYTPQRPAQGGTDIPPAQGQPWPYQGGFHPAPPAGQQSAFPPDQPPY